MELDLNLWRQFKSAVSPLARREQEVWKLLVLSAIKDPARDTHEDLIAGVIPVEFYNSTNQFDLDVRFFEHQNEANNRIYSYDLMAGLNKEVAAFYLSTRVDWVRILSRHGEQKHPRFRSTQLVLHPELRKYGLDPNSVCDFVSECARIKSKLVENKQTDVVKFRPRKKTPGEIRLNLVSLYGDKS